ncbi:MAG: SGNH/GDSL hydrolase family protein [Betaproteobacteria bacterium]|nr:SGNH/GDSL hydrolase family protein [Betaproteobacteria bacterium]
MTKRSIVALISAMFVMGVALAAISYKFEGFHFLQLSRWVQSRISGFRVPWSESDYYIPDSTAGHIHKPHAVRSFTWKEHPRGTIRMVVNNLGFREDIDTLTAKPGQTYRILVTGDSHMDGVVYNSESFTNRLEALLELSYKSPQFKVLNGGAGYYGPHNYAGFLKKFLYLKPDMYVVVLYTGNDFLDGITTAEIRHRAQIPKRPDGYYRALEEAASYNAGAIGQALNQAYFFKTFPELETTAVDVAYEQILDIARTCSSERIAFIVVTLPTK